MKTYVRSFAVAVAIFAVSFSLANAHMMDTPATDTDAPALTHEQEVAQGLALYQKIQSKQMSCADVKDADFELMGEYFMEKNMTMAEHDNMNNSMTAMMGHDGEEILHMTIGKHGSNCDMAASGESMENTNHGMNTNAMETHMNEDKTRTYSSPLMLLLYIFSLIGLVSVVKTIVLGAQKK